MTQKEFNVILDSNDIPFIQNGKWLIIGNKNYNNIYLDQRPELVKLPNYIWFKSNYIHLEFNKLKTLPKNSIFECKKLNISNNPLKNIPKTIIFKDCMIESYNTKLCITNYNIFRKTLKSQILMKRNIHEKFYNEFMFKALKFNFKMYSNIKPLINLTPHICIKHILKYPEDKKYFDIKLPKSFLSISSWI